MPDVHQGPDPEPAKLIRSWLDRIEPDLIGFQEVLRGAGVDPLRELLDGRGYHVEYAPAGPFPEDPSLEFGVAAASRWPVSEREVLALPKGSFPDPCVALSITTDSPLGPISFTTTHLMYAWYAGVVREQQVRALAELVLRRCPRGGFPAVVCGDFNARPESSEIRFLKGLQSWPSMPGRIERCTVVCDEAENGVFPSDHFGVYVELAGEPEPSTRS